MAILPNLSSFRPKLPSRSFQQKKVQHAKSIKNFRVRSRAVAWPAVRVDQLSGSSNQRAGGNGAEESTISTGDEARVVEDSSRRPARDIGF